MNDYPKKWRPSLGMVVIAMLAFVLCLPLASILLFRFYDSQLVRETENELIAQGAFVRAGIIELLKSNGFSPQSFETRVPGKLLPKSDDPYLLVLPKLDLAQETVLPRRDDARPVSLPVNQRLSDVFNSVMPIIFEAQKTTLAGFRLLDANGTVLAGRGEAGMSLAHVREVAVAMEGRYESVVRSRKSNTPTPPIYSISRGATIRIFVAMPIIWEDRLVGISYMSRTPSHFLREMYAQKEKLALAVLFVMAITIAIAVLFVRFIKGPIDALNLRTLQISRGDRDAFHPLSKHGTREIANLSKGLLSMSQKLQDRAEYIKNFASHVSHELKSPLTSIHGAAELLKDNDMSSEERERFLNNIIADTGRLTKLLERLRDLARADIAEPDGRCVVFHQIMQTGSDWPDVKLTIDGDQEATAVINPENMNIILSNLFQNSANHGATEVDIEVKAQDASCLIKFHDNGSGISEHNADKVFELFFTTRREEGGTGMGLGIIRSILAAHNGEIRHIPTSQGACFELRIPLS